VTDEKGKVVKVRNVHYAPSERVVVELVKESTELMRLLRGQPGSLDEQERKQGRDSLLAKLEKMAQSLQTKLESGQESDLVVPKVSEHIEEPPQPESHGGANLFPTH
jgi:hypothetical protein